MNKLKKTTGTPAKKTIQSTPDSRFEIIRKRYQGGLLAAIALYVLLVAFFAPVVFEGKGLSPAADMIAAAGMYETGEEAISNGRFPLWNPTLFCGLPMFASLQYALFVYPPEYIIRALSFIFGGTNYRIWLFHYLISGILAYLLARHLGAGRIAGWFAGAAYAFSPQLIVLVDVGHGSKLMAMTWLPLVWLLTDRLRLKPTIGRAAALGLAFAVLILALHPQVAAYGAMLMGIFLVYHLIGAIRVKAFPLWLKFTGFWASAMAIALGLASVLWISVLDYARFSMRGATGGTPGMTGGGVSWDYATGWSFHPFESITYFFPSFFGFGNETYWGTVGTPDGTPFTHNPMYFGIVVLLLAVFTFMLRPKKVWGFALTLGLVAWILSFGRYLPILYGPLYNFLPMFNKFRAPVMGQVLLLLSMAVLAGIGLQALLDQIKNTRINPINSRSSSPDPKTSRFVTILWVLAGVGALKALLIISSEDLFRSLYFSIAGIIQPKANPQVLQAALELARNDVARVLGILAILLGLTALALRRKIASAALLTIFIALFVIDLWHVNRKLITFTPRGTKESIFQAEGVVNHLTKSKDKFRLHPFDTRYRAANWWSYFGIETTNGYFGAKMSDYQSFMDAFAIDTSPPMNWATLFQSPQLLDALNVRYIISSYPLDMIFEELSRQGLGSPVRPASEYRLELMGKDIRPGAGPFLYRNPGEMPRARLVGDYDVVTDREGTFRRMKMSNWNPREFVLLNHKPTLEPLGDPPGEATIVSYKNENIVVKTFSSSPKILVLADTYYPSGWTATIDGKPAEILRADWIMRAVALPEGEHTVEFKFVPKWFYFGLILSLVTLSGILLIGGYNAFRIWKLPKQPD